MTRTDSMSEQSAKPANKREQIRRKVTESQAQLAASRNAGGEPPEGLRALAMDYPFALLAMSVAIGIGGPGAYSFDTLFGIALPSFVFVTLALAALVVDIIGIVITRPAPVVSQPPRTHAA